VSAATTREPRPAAERAGGAGRPPTRRPARDHRATRVVDADRRRARATEALLGALAPALGLDVGALRVRADEEAAVRTRPRAARGLAADGTIWLDPARYDPLRADGRALLAHEAAHVAQRAEARTRPDRRPPSLAEAEWEAAAVAAAVHEGRTPPLPRATLPPGAPAADTGAAVAAPPAPQQDEAGRDPLEAYRKWSDELDALVPAVRQVHARRIAQFEDELRGLWVSDGDVEDVLTALEPVPYEEAAALVRGLPPETRQRLAANISPSHRSGFRASVLAVTAGLLPSELSTQRDPLDGMPLTGLAPEERFLAIVVLLGLSPETRRRLIDSDRRAEVYALIEGPAPDAARLAEQRTGRRAAIEARRTAESAVAERAEERIARLQSMLSAPTAAAARSALDELAGLLPAATPEVAPTGPAEADPAQPPPPTDTPEFRVVVEALEQTGAVDRLIRALPETERTTPGPRRTTFARVIEQRSPDANVRFAQELLGAGVFNWISDAEARLAYDVVRALPLDARDRFLRRDDGRWLERLHDNLPADVLARDDFADLGVARDEHGVLVDSGLRRAQRLASGGAQVLRRILEMLDRGSGAETAARVLKELAAIDEDDGAVREAVVGRLDSLRRLDAVLERLSDTVLLSEESRPDLTVVLGAREPRQLERHIRRLLATGVFDWAVTSREAFLAFLMLRALPPGDRERFGRLDFIVGELSAEMRASAGLHVLAAGSADEQRESVRERLADERLWTAGSAPQLRALIQIAVALGERRWAFEQSELRRAWEDQTLNPIVQRFELYNPIVGRTRFVPELEDKGSVLEDFGLLSVIRAIGRAAWFVVSQGFRGTFYVDPWAQQAGIERLSLLELQQAAGGELGAATVSEAQTKNRYRTNELTLVWDQKAGTLDVDLPALELDSVGMVTAGSSLRTGAVSARGIKLHADFASDDLAFPRNADVAVDELTMLDVLAGGTTGLAAVTRLHLGGFGAHGDLTSLAPRERREKLLSQVPVPLFGPILQVVLMLIKAARIAPSGALLQGARAELETFELVGIALPGDQQAASVTVSGIELGWGATRAQYLRLLIDQLDRREKAARDEAERDRVKAQLDEAVEELAALEVTEHEQIGLLRRARNEPESMTEDDHRRLLELQRQGPGGVVVEIGPITIRGVGGEVTAREIEVDRVSGHGEAAAATLELLTDEAFLRRFTREGPPPEDLAAWSGEFELGNVTAVDVVFEDEIPSQEDLAREREQLLTDAAKLTAQPQILTRVKDRIGMLEMALELRRELDELAALDDPTAAQLERRRDLRTTLARHFGTAIDVARLTGARITGRADTATSEVSASELEISRVASDAYAAERITGTGFTAGYSVTTGAIGFGAQELRFEDVRADELGSTVASVDLTGMKGAAKEIEDGWRIEGLEIATMTLGLIDWGSTTKRITSRRPVTATGLKATVEATWTGEGAAAESVYAIKRLDIDQIAIPTPATEPGLIYEDFESNLRAELLAGAVKGVWAQDFAIRMGAETTFEAASDEPSIGFKRFDALRFAAAFGKSFQVGGVLTSPEPAAGESALGITFVGTDEYAFDLRNLVLTAGRVTTPDGSVRIVRLPMSGRVTYASRGAESDIGLEDFTVPDLVVGALDWRFKGASVKARGRSVLRGIAATAGIRRDEKGLAAATVSDIRIDEIEAEDLAFTRGPLEVHVNQPSKPGRPPLDVRDVHIQGVEYEREAGLTAGTIDVGPAAAGLEARYTSALAKGTLSAQAISVRFLPGKRIGIGAEDIGVAGDLTTGSQTASLAVSDVDARVDVEPKRIRVRASGAKPSPANLALPPIRIPALDFEVKGVHVQLLSGGTIDVDSLDTDVTIDLGDGVKQPAVRRVTLGSVDLGTLAARRLLVEDPTLFRVELQDPASPAVVSGLRVEGLALDQDLAGAWSLAGYAKLHADEIALDWIAASVEVAEILRRYKAAQPPGTTPTPFNPASLSPFAAAMNSLNGSIEFKLALPITLDAFGQRHRLDDPNDVNAPVRVVIRRGEVNVAQVVEAVGWGAQYGVGFALRGNQLVMAIDLAAAARHVPWIGPAVRTAFQVDVAWWTLNSGELTRLRAPDVDLDAGRVPLNLYRLTQVQTAAGGGTPAPGGQAIGRLRFHTDQLEYLDIDARLSMVNQGPLPIVLSSGTITLAPFALDTLRITGSLPGTAPLQLGVGALKVQSLDLALPYGLGQLKSGRLLLSGLTDGRMSFSGQDPQQFSGRVARLRWSDVTITGTPAP